MLQFWSLKVERGSPEKDVVEFDVAIIVLVFTGALGSKSVEEGRKVLKRVTCMK